MADQFIQSENLQTEKKNHLFSAQQISAKDPSDSFILSVVVKRTYQLNDRGECKLTDDQIPLISDMRFYDESDNQMSHDSDLYAYKPFTDIIIKGKARNNGNGGSFLAAIQIRERIVPIQVFGNRKVFLNRSGKIEFSEPAIVDEVPLRYDFAYGGRDAVAEKKIKLPPKELTKYLTPEMDLLGGNPCRYKRNPAGKGYIVEPHKSSIEQLDLPNLEDPEHLLTPQTLIVGNPSLWHKMPLPRCTDWVSPMWFPRIAYFGLYNLPPNLGYKIEEITKDWAEPKILSIEPMKGNLDFRCANGASLGLQLSYVKPKEKIRILNIHPRLKDFIMQLPDEHPEIWVDGRKGKLLPTRPFIQTIIIEPDDNRISVVWRGSGPALRPYFDEELKTMPFKVEWHG